jgi:hypothetical protein
LFDWETQIIETTQNIEPKGVVSKQRTREGAKIYGGEFAALGWTNIEDIDRLRLHRWVREVIKFYQSGQMKLYTPRPPEPKKVKKPASVYKAPWEELDFGCGISRHAGFDVQRKPKKEPSGADMLFDIAEMVLAKTDPDGTRYYMPRYAPAASKRKIVRQRTAAWK